MTRFDDDTRVTESSPGRLEGRVHPAVRAVTPALKKRFFRRYAKEAPYAQKRKKRTESDGLVNP